MDIDSFRSSLGAIFIHYCDSRILQIHQEIVIRLNKELAIYGLNIGTYYNHDNFAVGSHYALFAKAILHETYRTFQNSQHFEMIYGGLTDKQRALFQNILTDRKAKIKLHLDNTNAFKH